MNECFQNIHVTIATKTTHHKDSSCDCLKQEQI